MPYPSVADLNARFGLAGLAKVSAGNGGLPKIEVTTPAARGEIYLYGAHLTAWQPKGEQETLFLSKESAWREGHPIRGGVPICFPWFRNKKDDLSAPKHGFVRTKMWDLVGMEIAGDGVRVTLATQNDEGARKWWPHEFRLEYRVTFGATLKMELTMKNLDASPVTFEEALHLYHSVGDVHQVAVAGLNGVHYLDNMDGNKDKLQLGDLRFTRETDNAYMHTTATLEIDEPALGRRIILDKSGSQSTVTWNPWQESAAKLQDLGDDEWTQFAAVEVTNVIDCAVRVGSGESHTMTGTLRIQK